MAFRSSKAKISRVVLLSAAAVALGVTAAGAPPAVQQQRVPVKNSTVDLRVEQPAEKIEVLAREGATLEPMPHAVKGDAGQPAQVSVPKGTSVVIRKDGDRLTAKSAPAVATPSPE